MKKQITKWLLKKHSTKLATFMVLITFLQPSWLKSQTGSAVNFDGVDDRIDLGTAISGSLSNSSVLTVETWVRPNNVTGIKQLVGNHTGGVSTQFCLRQENNRYNFFIGQGLYGVLAPVNSATANVWQHVAAVFNNTVLTIYINGVPTTTTIPAYSLTASANIAQLANNGFGEVFGGNLDEVRIWKRALCQSEIVNNMNAELTAGQYGLLAYYKLNQGTAGGNNVAVTTATDASVNNVNGTLTNLTLTGATSNWITPGGVVNGSLAAVFTGTAITVNSGNINAGQIFTIVPTGGVNYTFTSVTSTVSPTSLSTYTVYGYDVIGGCLNKAVSTVSVNGAAFNFDRVNDYINLGTALTTSLANQNKFTVESWVRPTVTFTSGAYGCVVGNYATLNNTPPMQFLLRANNGVWSFFVQTAGSFTAVNSGTFTVNQWQHVSATWDGTVGSIYVNGVLSNTAAMAGSGFTTATNPVWIGGNIINNEYFGGDIDEVRIWNRVLCPSEIVNNMNAELNLPQNNLMAYYKLNQGSSGANNATITNVIDSSPSAITGTVTNATLSGTTSNWTAPGGVTSGSNVPVFLPLVITGPNTVCANSSATITASGNVTTYTWTGGPTTASNVVSPSVTTTYSVVGTSSVGCLSNIAIKTITTSPLPTITVNNGTICVGETFTITPGNASTYTIEGGNAVVSPTTTSNYTVVGTNSLGCVSSTFATSTIIVNLCTGIEANNNIDASFNVYPNPFNGLLNVTTSTSETKISIVDLLGKVQYSQTLGAGLNKLNLNQLNSGIYFIKAESNGSVKTIKLIKE